VTTDGLGLTRKDLNSMKKLKGSLTTAQHEIMQAIWEAGDTGATVAEVWKKIGATREVSRTTILNLVDRLEKRGWLKRVAGDSPIRYRSALGHEETATKLAEEFVEGFFGGSTANMVMSLLGSKKIDPDEVKRLRDLLDKAEPNRKGGAS
jgi:predicted transcriptional regulator